MLSLSRLLIIVGIILIITGGIFYLFARAGFQIGEMPGDIKFERGNLSCIFGLGISILLSIALTIILNFFVRFFK
ncbi:MAG: DUF2905 family protein [Anaerolineales bacterium]|jgi:Zn-dependent protease with chaperone function